MRPEESLFHKFCEVISCEARLLSDMSGSLHHRSASQSSPFVWSHVLISYYREHDDGIHNVGEGEVETQDDLDTASTCA